MTEGLINLVDDDSSQDVHSAGMRGEDDRLATTRLASHAAHGPPPPPPPSRRPVTPQGVVVPPARQSYPTGAASPGGMLYPSEPPSAMPRTSWWRSLIATTMAPAAHEDENADRRLGKVCIGVALGFAFVALLVALRSAPADAPGVAIAVVSGRTAVGLGLLAFGYGLLRMGERLLSSRSARRSDG